MKNPKMDKTAKPTYALFKKWSLKLRQITLHTNRWKKILHGKQRNACDTNNMHAGCIEMARNKEEKQGLLTDMQREQSMSTEASSDNKQQILQGTSGLEGRNQWPTKLQTFKGTCSFEEGTSSQQSYYWPLQISFVFMNISYLSPPAVSTSSLPEPRICTSCSPRPLWPCECKTQLPKAPRSLPEPNKHTCRLLWLHECQTPAWTTPADPLCCV